MKAVLISSIWHIESRATNFTSRQDHVFRDIPVRKKHTSLSCFSYIFTCDNVFFTYDVMWIYWVTFVIARWYTWIVRVLSVDNLICCIRAKTLYQVMKVWKPANLSSIYSNYTITLVKWILPKTHWELLNTRRELDCYSLKLTTANCGWLTVNIWVPRSEHGHTLNTHQRWCFCEIGREIYSFAQ